MCNETTCSNYIVVDIQPGFKDNKVAVFDIISKIRPSEETKEDFFKEHINSFPFKYRFYLDGILEKPITPLSINASFKFERHGRLKKVK